MNYFNILFLMILIIIEFTTAAYKWKVDEVPNPYTNPAPVCNLIENKQPFCDPEKSLDEDQVKDILKKQKEISMMGKCPCDGACKKDESGLVVGFVILKEIANSNEKLDLMNANSYALQQFADIIRKKWQLGTCDNSILIAIAIEPKQYGVSFGEKASNILNDTWITSIIEESFRNRQKFYVHSSIKDILYMLKAAISEELKKSELISNGSVASLTDSNNNNTLLTVFIICFVVVILILCVVTAFIILRHRKENDDVSLKDVWTKKFWTKNGNQYKEAKQSENVNEKDLEKNENEEVKAKLASTEDLKPVDDIENVDEDKLQFPKLSKV